MLGIVALDDPAQLRGAIRHWIGVGDALEEIERRLIEPARLSDDEKSGLWLYAWAAGAHRRAGLVPAGTT
jgi:hypothetical protein